jgi:hypothetical protein
VVIFLIRIVLGALNGGEELAVIKGDLRAVGTPATLGRFHTRWTRLVYASHPHLETPAHAAARVERYGYGARLSHAHVLSRQL